MLTMPLVISLQVAPASMVLKTRGVTVVPDPVDPAAKTVAVRVGSTASRQSMPATVGPVIVQLFWPASTATRLIADPSRSAATPSANTRRAANLPSLGDVPRAAPGPCRVRPRLLVSIADGGAARGPAPRRPRRTARHGRSRDLYIRRRGQRRVDEPLGPRAPPRPPRARARDARDDGRRGRAHRRAGPPAAGYRPVRGARRRRRPDARPRGGHDRAAPAAAHLSRRRVGRPSVRPYNLPAGAPGHRREAVPPARPASAPAGPPARAHL